MLKLEITIFSGVCSAGEIILSRRFVCSFILPMFETMNAPFSFTKTNCSI
jgi:hypothetical protein